MFNWSKRTWEIFRNAQNAWLNNLLKKARKPLVIEFAGVPKAGKTTTLSNVQTFLKRCGFHTDVVVERASVCPIRDKKHANFNIWTACTTLAQILEKTQNPPRDDDPQILFLDRGLFDSICWLTMMERISRLRKEEKEVIQKFLTIDDWRKRISAVFVMLVSPKDAMKREQGILPVEGKGGSIMNNEILGQIREVNEKCAEQLERDFRIYQINTSSGGAKSDPKSTAESVTDIILGLIEEQIAENILSCSKKTVKEWFENKNFVDSSKASKLARYFEESEDSNFKTRDEVEKDVSRVQALPVVVVRNADGDVLRLRRREKRNDNPLHEKIVIWAGGHVRCEDAVNGSPLVNCAVRELGEELRLQLESSSMSLIGAVYIDNGGSASKHVAIVYEWRAPKNDVSVVLSRTEFFERRGTSLSGSFASVHKLVEDVKNNKLMEPWSVELVREYLAKDKFEPRLF